MGPTPYESDRVIPYKYNATMLENGNEIPIPSISSIVNIVDISDMNRSGRVFALWLLKELKMLRWGSKLRWKLMLCSLASPAV